MLCCFAFGCIFLLLFFGVKITLSHAKNFVLDLWNCCAEIWKILKKFIHDCHSVLPIISCWFQIFVCQVYQFFDEFYESECFCIISDFAARLWSSLNAIRTSLATLIDIVSDPSSRLICTARNIFHKATSVIRAKVSVSLNYCGSFIVSILVVVESILNGITEIFLFFVIVFCGTLQKLTSVTGGVLCLGGESVFCFVECVCATAALIYQGVAFSFDAVRNQISNGLSILVMIIIWITVLKLFVRCVSQEIVQFIWHILYCILDTFELVWDTFSDIISKIVQFVIAIFNLIFQVLLFLRDLCIETMQTFANLIQGIVNVLSAISCEDVEDFASACIVVILWAGAVRILLNLLAKAPGAIQCENSTTKPDEFCVDAEKENFGSDECPRKSRRRKKTLRRHNNRRPTLDNFSNPCTDDEPSD